MRRFRVMAGAAVTVANVAIGMIRSRGASGPWPGRVPDLLEKRHRDRGGRAVPLARRLSALAVSRASGPDADAGLVGPGAPMSKEVSFLPVGRARHTG